MLLTVVQLYDSNVLHLSILSKTYWWHQLLSNGGKLFVHLIIYKYFLVHYDLFTNNLTSMLRFQIISHHLKKLNKFFERYIIINDNFPFLAYIVRAHSIKEIKV